MKTFVVDASVGAKWFLPPVDEPFASEAHRLLQLYTDNKVRLLVPDLFWAEIASVNCSAVVRGRLSVPKALAALDEMLALGLPSVPTNDLIVSALPIALNHKRSVYDSIYVAAAVTAEAELVTADEKLVNAVGTRFPVRWLGALRSLLS